MAFEFCCFISYPHGRENRTEPYIKDFVEVLKDEIWLLTRKKIFIDYDVMGGGYLLEKVISQSLCKSACMILIYTPLYFDTDHIWCARELKAMHDLEQQRLNLLSDKRKGLIIPIVLRGDDEFPEKLKKERLYYNFTSIKYDKRLETIREKYGNDIVIIADYIYKMCKQLDPIEIKLKNNCSTYCLPDSDVTKKFIETVLGTSVVNIPVSFPGRSLKNKR